MRESERGSEGRNTQGERGGGDIERERDGEREQWVREGDAAKSRETYRFNG